MDNKTYFDGVNVAKLILAVAIVAMHCALVPDHSLLMTLVCRLGVPYFFVASGFFLQRKCVGDQTKAAVKGYIKRLFLPYAVFSIIWIVQMLVDDVIEQVPAYDALKIVVQHILFFPRGALWYVWASIIGALMLYPFMRKKKLMQALPLGIALFLIGLLANNYYFIADGSSWLKPVVDGYVRIFLVSNNGPFVGFLFLLVGMLICEYYDRITEIVSVRISVVVLIISCVLLILEDSFIKNKTIEGDGAFYLSQLIYVPTVFYLTTRLKFRHISRAFSTTAKNLSTGVYFLHVPMLWIIHKTAIYVLPHLPGLARLAPLFDHASVCFVSCFVVCLVICLVAYKFPKSFLCKILK